MASDDVVSALMAKSDQELTRLVAQQRDLSQAIVMSHPEMAQDAGFELFDTAWAKRYWKSIVGQISGIGAVDKLYSWAVGASVTEFAKLVIKHYSLPTAATAAAVALTVILIRAAKASREESTVQ
jgi:hypothetical protein